MNEVTDAFDFIVSVAHGKQISLLCAKDEDASTVSSLAQPTMDSLRKAILIGLSSTFVLGWVRQFRNLLRDTAQQQSAANEDTATRTAAGPSECQDAHETSLEYQSESLSLVSTTTHQSSCRHVWICVLPSMHSHVCETTWQAPRDGQ